MANKKVKVLNAVVGGKTEGAILEIDEKTAANLVKNRYVEYVKEAAQAPKAPEGDKDKGKGDSKDKK